MPSYLYNVVDCSLVRQPPQTYDCIVGALGKDMLFQRLVLSFVDPCHAFTTTM